LEEGNFDEERKLREQRNEREQISYDHRRYLYEMFLICVTWTVAVSWGEFVRQTKTKNKNRNNCQKEKRREGE